MPGEAEAAAEILGIPYEEFFKAYLTATEDSYGVYALRPRMQKEPGGTIRREFVWGHRSPCVFYQDGKCNIHDVKPAECLSLICSSKEPGERFNPLLRAERIVEAWADAGDPLRPPMQFEDLTTAYEQLSKQIQGILGNGQTSGRSNGDGNDGSIGDAERRCVQDEPLACGTEAGDAGRQAEANEAQDGKGVKEEES